jgi:hypothetical protein
MYIELCHHWEMLYEEQLERRGKNKSDRHTIGVGLISGADRFSG